MPISPEEGPPQIPKEENLTFEQRRVIEELEMLHKAPEEIQKYIESNEKELVEILQDGRKIDYDAYIDLRGFYGLHPSSYFSHGEQLNLGQYKPGPYARLERGGVVPMNLDLLKFFENQAGSGCWIKRLSKPNEQSEAYLVNESSPRSYLGFAKVEKNPEQKMKAFTEEFLQMDPNNDFQPMVVVMVETDPEKAKANRQYEQKGLGSYYSEARKIFSKHVEYDPEERKRVIAKKSQ